MKKILAVFIFVSLLAVGLLATVDLSPYLAPERRPVPAADSPPIALQTGTNISSEVTQQSPAIQEKPELEQQAEVPLSQKPASAAPGADLPIAQLPVVTGYPELPALPRRVMAESTVIDESPLSQQTAEPAPVSPDLLLFELVPGNYPYSVLLETFDEKSGAEKAMDQYRREGLGAYWVKVDLGTKGIKYRLFVGAFADSKEAEAFAASHDLREKPAKNTGYACLIGIYPQEELNTTLTKLAAAEGTAYLMREKGGKLLLYMGAFYTQNGANELCQNLTALGVGCQAQARTNLLPQ